MKFKLLLLSAIISSTILETNCMLQQTSAGNKPLTALEISLFDAVEQGNTDSFNDLTQNYNVSVNIKDENGQTLLHRAAINGHIPIIDSLITHTRDNINTQDNYGMTPVHCAVLSQKSNNSIDTIKTLLYWGADLTIGSNINQLPLHNAVWRAYDVLELILRNNPQVINAQDSYGNTALHELIALSTFLEKQDVINKIELLKEHSVKLDIVNNKGLTPAEITSNPELKALLKPSALNYIYYKFER